MNCPYCNQPFARTFKLGPLLLAGADCNNCPGLPRFYYDDADSNIEDSIIFYFWNNKVEYSFTYLYDSQSFYLLNNTLDSNVILYDIKLKDPPRPEEVEALFNRIMRCKAFI